MNRLVLFFIIILNSGHFVGQDYHFSQYEKTLMILNPATVGNFEGFERFSFQNRNQWIGSGTQFMTTMANARTRKGPRKTVGVQRNKDAKSGKV